MKKKSENREAVMPPAKKVWLIMRLSILLILVSVVCSSAGVYSQNTSLSLKMNNQRIADVFDAIEQQSEFYFFYNREKFDDNRLVSVDFQNKKIDEILQELFKNEPVTYEIVDRNILVKVTTEHLKMSAQPQTIRGKVTDSSGSLLPGVSVVVKGTNKGTITGADGSYSVGNVPSDATLLFSFIGMKGEEVAVAGESLINVLMEEETVGIEEVVAIGYGTQKKLTVTGSIVSAKGEDIIKNQTPNVINSLTGILPGVIINNRSGEPGRDNPSVYVRGRSTTGDSTPLIIIDGVERDGLGKINPNDIENISVLKDASAAIYGARAANGVILVTTKQGKEGDAIFDFSFNQGFSQPTRNPFMADAYTFCRVYNEIDINEGSGTAKYSETELQKYKDGTDPNYPNTDWYDLMTQNLTPQHRTNLSVSGGNARLKYYLSIGELSQDGQFNYGSTNIKQYNFRSNVRVTVTDFLKVGLDLAGRYDDKHYPVWDSGSLYSHIFLYHPTWSLYWPGTKYLKPNRDSESIVNWVSDNAGTDDQKFKSLESTLNFRLDVPSVRGLSIEGSANYDASYSFKKVFNLPDYVYYHDEDTDEYIKGLSGWASEKADLAEAFDQYSTLTLNGKINFERTFGKHNVGAMVGYEQMKYSYDHLYAYRSDFPSTAIPELFAGSSDKKKQANDGSASETARQNYFGRVTYDFASKYMAQFIFRYDGSPNFPKNKRWGFFPGVSIGWRVSEESFMNNLSFINNLKIRGSYGEMGNDAVAAFQYLASYGYGSNYVIGNNDVIGLVQTGTPNPNITWEVAKTTNIGFESSLWNRLLGIEFDLFKTRRSNILTTRNAVVPDYTGLSLPDENIGIVENKGFELQLTHNNSFHELKYSLTGNFSFARNKVIFADEEPAAEEYQKATGRPIGSALYYKARGIYRDQEEVNAGPRMAGAQPGDIIYEDVNKDGSVNSYDRIRNNTTTIPEIVYSITTSLAYKNFDLTVLLQGQENADMSFGGYFRVLSPYSLGNFSQWRANDHWSSENINASMPRASLALWNNNSNYSSTHWLVDAGFLRVKNMEIGYNLPVALCEKMNIKKLRIHMGGNNLFLLHDHMKDIGYDPEATSYWYYPQQRTFTIGVNLTF